MLHSSRRPSRQGRRRLVHLRHLRCAGCIYHHAQEWRCAPFSLPKAMKSACNAALCSLREEVCSLALPLCLLVLSGCL